MFDHTVRGWGQYFNQNTIWVRSETPVSARKVRIQFKAPDSMTPVWRGVRCDFEAKVDRAGPRGPDQDVILKLAQPLEELVNAAASGRRQRLAFAFILMLALTVWLNRAPIEYFWYDPWLYAYSTSLGVYFFSRFLLCFFHRSPKLAGYEPSISMVISARNERHAIANTVESCFAADYPKAKREILLIDDGSTDGTDLVIRKLQWKYPELRAYRIPASGKRIAMAKGILEAGGEIIVVVDSDTLLDCMALRHIVCGFEDPTLGAVSGCTGVANADTNFLTRMQDIRYMVSFELMKASESVFGCVTCCPGCLSAYRRKYLLEILEPWLNQTFLGARATFGDDRSLTNFILRDYRVIYNPLACALTSVPDGWVRYLKQQCRWKKSWLREAPVASRILARKHPIAALSFYASAVCSLASPLVAARFFWYHNQLVSYVDGMLMLGLALALFVSWKRPSKSWYMTWYWIATQVVLMGPQTYYAILTMRKNHWGTR